MFMRLFARGGWVRATVWLRSDSTNSMLIRALARQRFYFRGNCSVSFVPDLAARARNATPLNDPFRVGLAGHRKPRASPWADVASLSGSNACV
jgi:hypothetical protein